MGEGAKPSQTNKWGLVWFLFKIVGFFYLIILPGVRSVSLCLPYTGWQERKVVFLFFLFSGERNNWVPKQIGRDIVRIKTSRSLRANEDEHFYDHRALLVIALIAESIQCIELAFWTGVTGEQ